jgi:hypothetical protein
MTPLADIDIGRIISTALIAVIVPIALGFLYRSAQGDSEIGLSRRCVDYPKALKIFVGVGWIFTVAIAIITTFAARFDDLLPSLLIFIGLILPLHLEAYFVRIIWDDDTIHTRSPWRRSRRIPISSVKRCDFSQSMQWYRIHTEGYGIVRLHMFARGIPQLLEALPVPNPGYPPNPKHKESESGPRE